MATVNQACASILEKVTSSKLDFSIHQTPYSIHFSIRRKFSRNSQNIPLDYSSPLAESQDDRLRQELLNTRKEYDRLHNFYLFECEAKRKLEEEYIKVLENIAKVEHTESNVKALKAENKTLKDNLEIKCLELKHRDCDNLHKDKIALSVALKAAKAKIKDKAKEFAKKEVWFEKKIEDLGEFKKRKLAEEREEKLRKRKELKKSNQKLRKESKASATEEDKDAENNKPNEESQGETEQSNCYNLNSNQTKSEPVDTDGLEVETNEGVNENDGSKELTETIVDIEDECIDENTEGFIGPKLPPMMTQEEIDAFFKEIMAKWKLDYL